MKKMTEQILEKKCTPEELYDFFAKLNKHRPFQVGIHCSWNDEMLKNCLSDGLYIDDHFGTLDHHIISCGKFVDYKNNLGAMMQIREKEDEIWKRYGTTPNTIRTAMRCFNGKGESANNWGKHPLIVAFPNQINLGNSFADVNLNRKNSSEADLLILESGKFNIEPKTINEEHKTVTDALNRGEIPPIPPSFDSNYNGQTGVASRAIPNEFILGYYDNNTGIWYQNNECLLNQPDEVFNKKVKEYRKVIDNIKIIKGIDLNSNKFSDRLEKPKLDNNVIKENSYFNI